MAQRLFGDAVERAPVARPAARRRRPGAARPHRPPLQRRSLRLRRSAPCSASRAAWRCSRSGLALGHRSERLADHSKVLLAAIAGILFALAGVAIKGLTGAGGVSLAVLAPWIAARSSLAGIGAQYAAAAALQRGGAIETIGLIGLVANAAQIVGGVLVFGDPLAASPLGLGAAGERLRDGLRLGAADPVAAGQLRASRGHGLRIATGWRGGRCRSPWCAARCRAAAWGCRPGRGRTGPGTPSRPARRRPGSRLR